jgi:hypothetical protein
VSTVRRSAPVNLPFGIFIPFRLTIAARSWPVAAIALPEDRVLLPSPCQRHLQSAGGREAFVNGRAFPAGQVIGLGDLRPPRSAGSPDLAEGGTSIHVRADDDDAGQAIIATVRRAIPDAKLCASKPVLPVWRATRSGTCPPPAGPAPQRSLTARLV